MASNLNDKLASSIYCKTCGAANPVQATYCMACREPLSMLTAGTSASTNPLTGLLLPAVIIQQRYRILEVLSTDEESTVYKVEDIQLGNRVVALKELGQNNSGTRGPACHPEGSEGSGSTDHRSFAALRMTAVLSNCLESRGEMLLLAGLIHPNLPRIYDYFVENQRWYFVMDFLAGETLEAYLKKRNYRPLPVEEVVDMGIQLSTVLDYLHRHQPPLGFTDLTLNTIWRTPDGKLYLLDVGTAAPAAAMPQRSSILSLGRVLRQLQTGKTSARPRLHIALPWTSSINRLSTNRHSTAVALPLKMLIQQMIHKDVRKRPYTMGMVKQELQHLALQHLPPKKGRFSRRTLLKLGGQLAGLGALAAVSSLLTWQVETQARRQVPHPDYSPSLGGTIYSYDAQNSVLAVAWSPNGTRVAMGGGANQVQAWDANTGHHVINFRDPGLQQRVEALIWLPDGRSIVAGGDDSLVWIWNATTGNIQDIYRGHTNSVITLACSLDGQYIASGGLDQTVQVWKVATGQKNATYSGHSDGIGSVSWSPDGKYIASASFDRTVQVWEAATGHHVFTYTGHTDKVYAVAWSPNGQRIASGGHDLTVQVWPVPLFEKNGQRQERPIIYRGHTRAIQALAWSPDSRTIASAADNVQLWNGLTGKHIFTYKGHAISIPLEVQAVAWSPNGRYITSGGMEGTVQVWNAR